jgi:transposase
MTADIIWLLFSALVASLLTIGAAWFWWRKWLSRELDILLDEKIEKLGDEIEQRVRQGVVNGVASIPSAEVLQSATRTASKTGAAIIGEGIAAILGRKNDK